jgi:hypothetical protein
MVTDSPARRNGGEKMTLDQLIEQVRVERTKAAAQLSTLDAALAALTRATAVTAQAPGDRKGRVWTPEQRAQLSATMKKRFGAAKKSQRG